LEQISALIDRATAVRNAHAEKSAAFDEIVRRFQDMAFGCAYAVLGDFYLAEDAAQEAFLSAWRNLDQLREPAAFPGWLKRIVLTQCNRITRGKHLEMVALEEIEHVPAPEADVPAIAAQNDERSRLLHALNSLPEHERMVARCSTSATARQTRSPAFLNCP
jgi:RNA polymerase sigma-70 factor (ECF subfamily)